MTTEAANDKHLPDSKDCCIAQGPSNSPHLHSRERRGALWRTISTSRGLHQRASTTVILTPSSSSSAAAAKASFTDEPYATTTASFPCVRTMDLPSSIGVPFMSSPIPYSAKSRPMPEPLGYLQRNAHHSLHKTATDCYITCTPMTHRYIVSSGAKESAGQTGDQQWPWHRVLA